MNKDAVSDADGEALAPFNAQREALEKERHGVSSCVTLDKACALSGPQFPHLEGRRFAWDSPAAPPPL